MNYVCNQYTEIGFERIIQMYPCDCLHSKSNLFSFKSKIIFQHLLLFEILDKCIGRDVVLKVDLLLLLFILKNLLRMLTAGEETNGQMTEERVSFIIPIIIYRKLFVCVCVYRSESICVITLFISF